MNPNTKKKLVSAGLILAIIATVAVSASGLASTDFAFLVMMGLALIVLVKT